MTGESLIDGIDRLPTPEVNLTSQQVAVLEAGGQYAMDIEQQLKRMGFEAIRLPFDTPYESIQGCGAVILSGGPQSVDSPDSPKCDPRIVNGNDGNPPVLGICYGEQLINYMSGGTVESLDTREDGFTNITIDSGSPLFADLDESQEVLMSHGDTVVDLAPGFEVIARSGDLIAGIANTEKRLYGTQFHPEVSTAQGPAMLYNFLTEISGMDATFEYSVQSFIQDATKEIQDIVDGRQVLAYVSGGVDSSALAKILESALPGDELFLVYVNNGFMREGESEWVKDTLASAGIDVRIVDASEEYFNATTTINGLETPPLCQVVEPEMKRKIIGDFFIKIQEQMAEKMGLDVDTYLLAMGTLYTDLIESGSSSASGHADVIKSHHNDTELVRKLREAGRVLEPWRYLQKDDVREVSRVLNMPSEISERQPFPGPGLAIRIICAERPTIPEDFYETAKRLESFDTESVKTSLLPIQTVGVQGDHRTYGHLVGLSGEASWPEFREIARAIPKNVHGVNRVVRIFGEDIVSGPITEITPTLLTPEVVEQLRGIDDIVNKKLAIHGLDRSISQVPVILFPVSFGESGARSIGIRTIMTTNFKTGDIALPGEDFPEEVLAEIVEETLAIPGIARVVYDLTSKPPGTTEWE